MLKRRWLLSFVGLIFLSSFALSIFAPFVEAAPNAADSGEWIDKTRITYEDNYYIDSDPFDNLPIYVATGSGNGTHCGSIIAEGGRGRVYYKKVTSLGGCDNVAPDNKPDNVNDDGNHSFDITLSKSDRASISAYRLNQDTLFMPICRYREYKVAGFGLDTKTSENCVFKHFPADIGAPRSIYPRFLASGSYQFQSGVDDEYSGEWISTTENKQYYKGCSSGVSQCNTQDVGIRLANNGNATQPPAIYGITINPDGSLSGETVTGGGDLESQDAHVDCETGYGGSLGNIADVAVSWFMCPIIDGAQAVVNTVGGFVVDQLIIDPAVLDSSECDNPGDTKTCGALAVKSAWNDFRIISLSLLIVVALFAGIFSQFIDAYTFKKILPRMLIAIIAISLSWDLMKLALDLTNAVGIGVAALIQTPFQQLNRATIDPSIIFAGGAGVAVAGAAGAFSFLALFAFIGTAALAVLTAFFFTSVRYVAIVAFIIFAPIAILASILPGTEKAWNFWKSGLIGALMMLPIIMAIIALGEGLGRLVATLNQGVAGQLLAIIVTYGPYFLIPKAFTWAGGAVANLSGMVNDKSKGGFDRLRQFRQNQNKKVKERSEAENRWSRLPKRFGKTQDKLNKFAQTAQVLPKSGLGVRDALNKDKRNEILGLARGGSTEEAVHEALKDPLLNTIYGNDDAAKVGARLRAGYYSREATAKRLQKENPNLYGPGAGAAGAAALESRLDTMLFDEDRARQRLIQKSPDLFAGAHNKAKLDQAMAGFGVLSKRYGSSVLSQAASMKRGSSSTAFLDDAKAVMNADGSKQLWTGAALDQVDASTGERYGMGGDGKRHYEGEIMYEYDSNGEKVYDADVGQAAGKMLREALEVTHGNFAEAVTLTMKLRAMQDQQAMRHDVGGGGASATLTALSRLASGDITTEEATAIVVDDAARGKTPDEAAQGGKGASAKGMMRGYGRVASKGLERVNTAYAAKESRVLDQLRSTHSDRMRDIDAATATGQITAGERKEALERLMTADQRKIIESAQEEQRQEAIAVFAREDSAHAAFARTSQDAKAESGKRYSQQIALDTLPEKLRLQLTKRVQPNPRFDKSKLESPTNPMTVEYYDTSITHMGRGAINDKLREDETWRAINKEYGASAAQAEEARAAAAARGASAAEENNAANQAQK